MEQKCCKCGNGHLVYREVYGGADESTLKAAQLYCVICGWVRHGALIDCGDRIVEHESSFIKTKPVSKPLVG